ncbi:MAG TPA: M1 family metallopeptidase [Kofleriaceae bacterium]|jgi:alanyl aminopeptidase|nr:M1 family metallopeptidase [Kofleriaceae bacterium]
MKWSVIVGCVLASACGPAAPVPVAPPAAATHPSPPPPAAAADPAPPELRLPATAHPTHDEVELWLDPSTEDFKGAITIALEVTAPTPVLWLNADEIHVDDAAFTAGGKRIRARAIAVPKHYVGLVPETPLAPGAATLVIRYAGKMHPNDGDGIYTVREGDDRYAFTQFEATDARQAFPCFDEPGYKVPWQVTIHTRKDLVALSNTPIESEQDDAGGGKTVRFAETRPLPSYLVAFAVGPFEAVDAGKTRAGGPIRVVVPRGHAGEVAYAAETTKPLLDRLEDYFGMPYPYPKLDLLAVPVFNAGAMENAGLITFQAAILQTKPAEQTLARKRTFATVAAHEMAHQWFGDYVTLAWWDDTWLNESFASWMKSKIVDEWQPKWDLSVSRVGTKSGAMGADSLDTARQIRQPIATANDIANAFDGITYAKGEAVLTMIERLLGAEVFQRGVRAYLGQHAWGNATYQDFVGAMSTAAGRDLHPLFDSFVRQSGVPLVSFELSCKAGAPPRVALAQRRFVPTGSKIDPSRSWTVPVCVRWGAGGVTGHDCTTLTGETGELALSARTCPSWVLPNEGGLGYYRMLPRGKLLTDLIAAAPRALTLPERVGLLGDIRALVASGEVQNGVALGLVGSLAGDKSRHIVEASIGIVAGINEMVPAALRPNYERMIRRLYGARARELGWHSRPGEDDNIKQLRPGLLGLVADGGHDPELIREATALTRKWFDDHKAIEPELVGVALSVAARYGDQALFDRFHAEARKVTDRPERRRLLFAMAGFTDPKIVAQSMGILLTDEFELREAAVMLQAAFFEPRTREAAYQFLRAHFDELAAKLPDPMRPFLGFTLAAMCDDTRTAEFEQLYRPRMEKFNGGPRVMAQALESMALCSAQHKAQAPGVIAFLQRQ